MEHFSCFSEKSFFFRYKLISYLPFMRPSLLLDKHYRLQIICRVNPCLFNKTKKTAVAWEKVGSRVKELRHIKIVVVYFSGRKANFQALKRKSYAERKLYPLAANFFKYLREIQVLLKLSKLLNSIECCSKVDTPYLRLRCTYKVKYRWTCV